MRTQTNDNKFELESSNTITITKNPSDPKIFYFLIEINKRKDPKNDKNLHMTV